MHWGTYPAPTPSGLNFDTLRCLSLKYELQHRFQILSQIFTPCFHLMGSTMVLSNIKALCEYYCYIFSEDQLVPSEVIPKLDSDEGEVRLVGGSTDSEGRVEIFHNGRWGTVCDDYWDLTDANVVCKQLGFIKAIQAVGSARMGQGVDPIFLDDVKCTGLEQGLAECDSAGWEITNCGHSEDAGVICAAGRILTNFRLFNLNNFC